MARQHRYLQAIGKTVSPFLFGVIVGIALILLIALLGQAGLLDLTTILSVAVTEVGLSLFLYYFLGQNRRGDEEEMVNLMDAVEKFSHLKVYKFSVLRTDFYYVENTTTKEYFKATERIESMVDLGVITVIACKNEEDMRAKLEKNGSHPNEQEPTMVQLKAIKHRRKKAGAVTSPSD
jgi:hypothetical protein